MLWLLVNILDWWSSKSNIFVWFIILIYSGDNFQIFLFVFWAQNLQFVKIFTPFSISKVICTYSCWDGVSFLLLCLQYLLAFRNVSLSYLDLNTLDDMARGWWETLIFNIVPANKNLFISKLVYRFIWHKVFKNSWMHSWSIIENFVPYVYQGFWSFKSNHIFKTVTLKVQNVQYLLKFTAGLNILQ